MALAYSRVTAQGQISVPADVRRKLGVGPGSVLEWQEQGDHIVVRRSARVSTEELHHAVFPEGPPKATTPDELTEGIRQYVRKRYASR